MVFGYSVFSPFLISFSFPDDLWLFNSSKIAPTRTHARELLCPIDKRRKKRNFPELNPFPQFSCHWRILKFTLFHFLTSVLRKDRGGTQIEQKEGCCRHRQNLGKRHHPWFVRSLVLPLLDPNWNWEEREREDREHAVAVQGKNQLFSLPSFHLFDPTKPQTS